MSTHIITLPYQTPPLTENQRLHWQPRRRLVKEVRDATHELARAARIPAYAHVTVSLHYQPRDARRRDADNLVPTLKACCDGLVDAGVVPDDTPDYMTKVMPVILPPARMPALRLIVEETP